MLFLFPPQLKRQQSILMSSLTLGWSMHIQGRHNQAAVAATLAVGELAGCSGGWGGLRCACQSVSHFQTSGFFWLKSLIRFIMHIPALIKVIGVWHSQCQVTEAKNAPTPLPSSCQRLLIHAWNVWMSDERCFYLTDIYRPTGNKQ